MNNSNQGGGLSMTGENGSDTSDVDGRVSFIEGQVEAFAARLLPWLVKKNDSQPTILTGIFTFDNKTTFTSDTTVDFLGKVSFPPLSIRGDSIQGFNQLQYDFSNNLTTVNNRFLKIEWDIEKIKEDIIDIKRGMSYINIQCSTLAVQTHALFLQNTMGAYKHPFPFYIYSLSMFRGFGKENTIYIKRQKKADINVFEIHTIKYESTTDMLQVEPPFLIKTDEYLYISYKYAEQNSIILYGYHA